MKGNEALPRAIASRKIGTGRENAIWIVLSSLTFQSSMNCAIVCPKVSRPAHRFGLWTQS